MKRAGNVVGTAQGVVVIRSSDDSTLDIGQTVIDADLDELGRVVDVFGPVEQPYVAVSPDESTTATASLVGSKVYAREK